MLHKSKIVRSREYLDWVRNLPCIVCLSIDKSPPHQSDPHHVPEVGKAAMGMKTSDLRAIPLCHYHHNSYHQIGRESFRLKYDLDYEFIISGLNKIWEEKNE